MALNNRPGNRVAFNTVIRRTGKPDSNWNGNTFSAAWNIEIGEGRSQVVGAGNEIYVTTGSSERKEGKNQLTTRIVAINLRSGEEIWSQTQSSTMCDDQESFGGAQAAPQSTPAIVGNCLVAISFAGQLSCSESQRWRNRLEAGSRRRLGRRAGTVRFLCQSRV